MRAIAILSPKGGCGKTTVAINLSAILASMGHRTLLVDLNAGAHCALGLSVPAQKIEVGMGELLHAGIDGAIGFEDIRWQVSRNLDLAPATPSLATIESSGEADQDRRLSKLLGAEAGRYDFCIIDCPPSGGILTQNALQAAGEILMPVETSYLGLTGLKGARAWAEKLARDGGRQPELRVLPTLYEPGYALSRRILDQIKAECRGELMPISIHRSSQLQEAISFGQSIAEYAAGSESHQQFAAVAGWLVNNRPRQVAVCTMPAASRAVELAERARRLSLRTRDVAASSAVKEHAIAGRIEPSESRVQAQTGTHGTNNQAIRNIFGVRQTDQGMLFVQPLNGASTMQLTGDFNGWTTTPMTRNEDLGVWKACVSLDPGSYRYHLVADGNPVADPYNDVSTGESGIDCAIEVG